MSEKKSFMKKDFFYSETFPIEKYIRLHLSAILQMNITPYTQDDFEIFCALSWKLFSENDTDYDYEELVDELRDVVNWENYWIYFAVDESEYIWFIYMAQRSDYVEWSSSSPVWYIEWVYVSPEYRWKWVARSLFEAWKKRAKEHSLAEIWSDTWLANTDSQKFHEKLWFREESRLVHYIIEV